MGHRPSDGEDMGETMACKRSAANLAAVAGLALGGLALVLPLPAAAQKKYGPGVTDKEVKIGQTMPYSGPLSALGQIGKAAQAYFEMINAEQGGINGRRIRLISYDDGYSPPKTVEMTRKLVEEEEVLAIFNTLGTPTNSAIHKYLNERKVPHLFITTGADKWADPKGFPWTMTGMASYQTEGGVYATHILKTKPNAKIGLLVQNDDFGRDYVAGFRRALGPKAQSMIVSEVTYEVTDPTVDSQIAQLKTSGADTFFSITTGKFTTQAIRRAWDIEWKPLFFIPLSATSVSAVLQPAGLDKAVGIVTAAWTKSVSDPQWDNDPGMKRYLAFMQKHMPGANPVDSFNVSGYISAHIMEQVLRQAGDDLTRENLMKQAASLKGFAMDMMLPGVRLDTAANDFRPIEQLRLQRFNGRSWELFGEILEFRVE